MMRKLLTLTLAVLLVGLFAAVVFAAVESGDGSPSSTNFGTTDTTDTTTGTTETTTTETTTTPGDISGPCDEAENRNDPRCAGVTVPPAPVAPQPGVDISGPCDEPEHFGDPRCSGAQPGDSSGPGPGFDDDSGHGGGSSGPGSGGFDDSGHGGDDFDDSGHGGDDSGRGRGRGRGGDDD